MVVLAIRAARGSRSLFEAALAAVPDVPPEEYDRLHPAGTPAANDAPDEAAGADE